MQMATTRAALAQNICTESCRCFPEIEILNAVKDHRARVAKAKEVDAGPIISAGQPTSARTTTKLPPIVVQLDDIGKIVRRKVPFVRPIVWDVWDKNAPSYTYESLGVVMRNNLFPGQNR